jgi:N-methylhydantoinase B/oxoprolinase/acetone carboxylase alpha subunit
MIARRVTILRTRADPALYCASNTRHAPPQSTDPGGPSLGPNARPSDLSQGYAAEHPNRPTRTAQDGDIIARWPQGGGYGDALERDPDSVLGDVKAGLISVWTAENVYQLRLDGQTLALDLAATEKAR